MVLRPLNWTRLRSPNNNEARNWTIPRKQGAFLLDLSALKAKASLFPILARDGVQAARRHPKKSPQGRTFIMAITTQCPLSLLGELEWRGIGEADGRKL